MKTSSIESFVINTLEVKGVMSESNLDQYFYDCFDMHNWSITAVKKRMTSFDSVLRRMSRKGTIIRSCVGNKKHAKMFVLSLPSTEKKDIKEMAGASPKKGIIQKIFSFFN